MTASSLRSDIYGVLDRILETGEPVDIERNGRLLRIVAVDGGTAPSAPQRRDAVIGDPADLVSISWADAWQP